jgi:L-ascorbate metabolism protein UlaG (beta-lactamase superfamily)
MTPLRSDHFNGKTFFQAHHNDAVRRRDFWRWRLTAKPRPWPAQVALASQAPPPAPHGSEVVVTWIGHATFLLQTAQGNFLTDPVFSERASPLTWLGPRRAHAPGLAFDALPKIDAVLLSHDHYDHCDMASLRALAARHDPVFITPLRNGDLLTSAGGRKIVELDWWQTHALNSGAAITVTPSKHWSNRLGTPRNHRLWGGFFLEFSILDSRFSIESTNTESAPMPEIENRESKIENSHRRVWFVGDTGYDADIFRRVRERCGAPDLALVPIGAYEPRWFMAPMHMNPAEAVQLHRDVGARLSLGMHWGTFQLTDEGRDEPREALVAARAAAGLNEEAFRIVAPGETIVV